MSAQITYADLICFWLISKIGVAGFCCSSFFRSLRNLHTVCHYGLAKLHSKNSGLRCLFLNILSSTYCVLIFRCLILTGSLWFSFAFSFICVFLITSEPQPFLMCLWLLAYYPSKISCSCFLPNL